MSLRMIVECPRCGKHWTVAQGTPDITCNCHLYCPDGDKPEDCTVTPHTFSGQLGYPRGLHVNAEDGSDDVLHITYYCSTHGKYYNKTPVLIECDWNRWFSRRAPEDMRISKGQY